MHTLTNDWLPGDRWRIRDVIPVRFDDGLIVLEPIFQQLLEFRDLVN